MHRRWWKNDSLISRCCALAALVLLAPVPTLGQAASRLQLDIGAAVQLGRTTLRVV